MTLPSAKFRNFQDLADFHKTDAEWSEAEVQRCLHAKEDALKSGAVKAAAKYGSQAEAAQRKAKTHRVNEKRLRAKAKQHGPYPLEG